MVLTAAGVSAASTTLRALYEVIRDARDSSDPRKLKDAIDVAYERLLTARESVAALQDEKAAALNRIAELEQELAKKVDFEEKSSNYELHGFHPAAYAYMKKGTQRGDGNSPRYCQPCFDRRELSLLHATGEMHQRERYFGCPVCQAKFLMGYATNGPVVV